MKMKEGTWVKNVQEQEFLLFFRMVLSIECPAELLREFVEDTIHFIPCNARRVICE